MQRWNHDGVTERCRMRGDEAARVRAWAQRLRQRDIKACHLVPFSSVLIIYWLRTDREKRKHIFVRLIFRRVLRSWLIWCQYRFYFNPQLTSIANEKAFKSTAACWIQYTFLVALFLPFSSIFLRRDSFCDDFILIQVQRIDVSENMRSTAAMHLTFKPNI